MLLSLLLTVVVKDEVDSIRTDDRNNNTYRYHMDQSSDYANYFLLLPISF